MNVRWNIATHIWEFWEPAWGGWCVLRIQPSSQSRPVTYSEGLTLFGDHERARQEDINVAGHTARSSIEILPDPSL